MISKNEIFELETRKRIFNFIKDHPGFHRRELERVLNIPFSTLTYHVRYLEKNELIEVRKQFIGRKPNTIYLVTSEGKKVFESHLDAIEQLMKRK